MVMVIARIIRLCDWDGGDCCVGTCVDGTYACGEMAPFNCTDPSQSGCQVPYPQWVGDGWCDGASPYNTAECGWDGGDCCVGTCIDGTYACGEMAPFNHSTAQIRLSPGVRLHTLNGSEMVGAMVIALTTQPSVAGMAETAARVPASTVLTSVVQWLLINAWIPTLEQ